MAFQRTAAAVQTLGRALSSAGGAGALARPQAGAAAAPPLSSQLQQARGGRSNAPGIAVDVPNGNVDRAWRALSRKLREEGYMEAAQAQSHYIKPSERRKQAASAAAKRFRKQEFSNMLGWIMRRRAGGF